MASSIRVVFFLISIASVALAADHFLFKSSQSGKVEATKNVSLKGKLELTGDARVRTLYSESSAQSKTKLDGNVDSSVHISIPGGLHFDGSGPLIDDSLKDEKIIDASLQVDFKGKLQLTGNASIKPAD